MTEAPDATVSLTSLIAGLITPGIAGRHGDADERQRDAGYGGAWFRQRSDLHGAGERAGHDQLHGRRRVWRHGERPGLRHHERLSRSDRQLNGAVTEGHGKTVSLTCVDCRADHAGDGGGHRNVDARQCDARQRGAWFRQRSDLHGAGERAGHD